MISGVNQRHSNRGLDLEAGDAFPTCDDGVESGSEGLGRDRRDRGYGRKGHNKGSRRRGEVDGLDAVTDVDGT